MIFLAQQIFCEEQQRQSFSSSHPSLEGLAIFGGSRKMKMVLSSAIPPAHRSQVRWPQVRLKGRGALVPGFPGGSAYIPAQYWL